MSKTKEFDQHISNSESSGLSKAAYCKEHELTYSCFLYHFKRKSAKALGFSRVNIEQKKNHPLSSGIEYHFADGSYFVFPSNCSVQLIRSLIG